MDAYESLGAIGEGTYGVVIRARHKATGQVVAIKRFKESEEDEQTRKTSLREVRVLKQLKHDNVVGLLDVFRRKGKLHIVFEYIEKTILEVLDATPRGIDPLSVKKYMYQLLRGLEFCHSQNIVHRDVKPENILISERGTLKICDFGFARPMTAGGKYTDYVATRWYRAPELLVGDVEYGKGVDIWAVGCIFSEISTGQPLFPGESDYDQLAHILRCCGKIPQRFVQIFYKNPLYKNVDLPQQRITESLDDKFRHPPSSCWLNFLKSCLKCDPSERSSCTQLLQNPYFEDSSDFVKSKYEAQMQVIYDEEQQLRAQLMAVSPPPPQPSVAPAQQPAVTQPAQRTQTVSTNSANPLPTTGPASVFLPDLGGQQAGGFDGSITQPASIGAGASVGKQQNQNILWSQYLASASHELPELGARQTGAMPSIAGQQCSQITEQPKVVAEKQQFTLKTTSTKLPTASMPPLQQGYRLPNIDQSGAAQGSSGALHQPPAGSVKVKDRTSVSVPSGPPVEIGAHIGGHKSPTPPNSLSVVGQGGKTSPSPTTGALSSQLAYKKKSQKKSVLTSLNFTAYESQPVASSGGGGFVPPNANAGKHTGLNSGLDPFGGGLFVPGGSVGGLPRGLQGTYPTGTASPYPVPQDRRGSNGGAGGANGHVSGHDGKLSDLILKGRTSQQQQFQGPKK